MRLPRFYCPELTVGELTLDAAQSRHARSSLRLRDGDAVSLFDGRGRTAEATIAGTRTPGAGGQVVRVKVRQVNTLRPPRRSLTLIVAGCKAPRLRWMVEKCTELGVSGLVLAEFERSVVHVGRMHAQKLRKTAIEACKQCGRNWLPELSCGVVLDDAIRSAASSKLIVTDPHAEATASEALATAQSRAFFSCIIGPEGGLTDNELRALCTAGAQLVRLADHTLRVETAAVAVAANWSALKAD